MSADIHGIGGHGCPLDPTSEQQETLDRLAERYDSVSVRRGYHSPLELEVECFDHARLMNGQPARGMILKAEYEIREDGRFTRGVGDA
jgi:hypothetical protein